MAKYPWEAAKAISTDEASKVYILTDSRLHSKGQPQSQYQTIKQVILARNLVVCFASQHVFATAEALRNKLNDPSTRGLNSQASERDVNRLGRMLLEQHKTRELGGFSHVLAALWPKGSTVPKLYQLMPPSYKPDEREGIVGVGDDDVLMRFKDLLPDQLERQRLTPDDPQFDPKVIDGLRRNFGDWPKRIVWEQVMLAVEVAFTDALLDTQSQIADVPITWTLLDKEGIKQTPRSAVLTPTDQLLHVTEFTKPGFYGKYVQIPQYTGGPQNAVQLFT